MTFGPFRRDDASGQVKWAELHGSDVQMVGDRYAYVHIPIACQALSDEGLCSLYEDAERPQLCADWPRNPVELASVPECGYRFERIEES